jgi:hypothetical protein
METNHRKVGRPKAAPRTGPLVLGEDHERTKVILELSDRAAAELAEYAHWVEECSGITAGEAKFKTVDFALREIFRRDRVWQAQRRKIPESRQTPAPAPTSVPPLAPTAPRAPSPSQPPPAPLNPRTSP